MFFFSSEFQNSRKGSFLKNEILKKMKPQPQSRISVEALADDGSRAFFGELLKRLARLGIPSMAHNLVGSQLKAKCLGACFIDLGRTPSGSYVLFFPKSTIYVRIPY